MGGTDSLTVVGIRCRYSIVQKFEAQEKKWCRAKTPSK